MREFKNLHNPVINPGGDGVPRLTLIARTTIVTCFDPCLVIAQRVRADAVF